MKQKYAVVVLFALIIASSMMSSVVFIRPGYCGDIWCIPRTSQRIRKPLCYRHTWFRFYDEIEYKYIHNDSRS